MTLSNLPKKNGRKVVSTEQTLNAVGKPKIEASGISIDSSSPHGSGRPHGRISIRVLTNRVSPNASTSLNWHKRSCDWYAWDGGGPKKTSEAAVEGRGV
jgi:hypothetical protein